MAEEAAIIRSPLAAGAHRIASGSRVISFELVQGRATDDTVLVTQNPVERPDGMQVLAVSDGVIRQPLQLTFSAILNDRPRNSKDTEGKDRHIRDWEALRDIMYAGEVVSLATHRRTYPEMLIQQCSADENGMGRNALRVTLQLIEVRFAERETALVPTEYLQRPSRSASDQSSETDGAREMTEDEEAEATAAAVDAAGPSPQPTGMRGFIDGVGATDDFRQAFGRPTH